MNARITALLTERFEGIDTEVEIHIEDATHAYLMAYERFQMFGCPHDRDMALELLHARDEALRNLPAHVQAARHAAFEQALDEQVAYFQSEAAVRLAEGHVA